MELNPKDYPNGGNYRTMNMNLNEAKEWLRSNWKVVIEGMGIPKSQDGKGYVCPICGHGQHGDGLVANPKSQDGNSLHCFGCDFSGDIIDLYMDANHLDRNNGKDFVNAIRVLAIENNLKVGTDDSWKVYNTPSDTQKSPQKQSFTSNGETTPQEQKTQSEPVFKFIAKRGTDYYKECVASRNNSKEAQAYLKQRGISNEVADACLIGYDADWKSPTAIERGSKPPASRRIIIPTSDSHYIARAIDDSVPPKFQKMNEGQAGLFNTQALDDKTSNDPVFIVEGAFDAMSIIEVGGKSLALNSTSNVSLLLDRIENTPPSKTLIVALDNDKGGKGATKELTEGLRRLNVTYIVANPCVGFKDANEALQKDREALKSNVDDAINNTSPRPNRANIYLATRYGVDMTTYKELANVPTGFPNLDKVSDGLFQGLYIIAAISSLGKTTFAIQLADNLARSGKEVIFFSLEQSSFDIITTSLARIMTQDGVRTRPSDVRKGEVVKRAFNEALKDYRDNIGERLSIVEGNFNCDITYIENYVRHYVKTTSAKPYVFVDYLQILQPDEDRQTTKEKVDKTITTLKRVSRDLGLTIFVISSVNRANYTTQIDFESLKESGGLEYTADVVWGFQLEIVGTDDFNNMKDVAEKRKAIREEKKKNPRKVELLCLKNRNGVSSYSCYFDYYAPNGLFIDRDSKKRG